MADLTTQPVGNNYGKFINNISDGGEEYIIVVRGSDLTNEDLLAVYNQLTNSSGDGEGTDVDGADAGTFAAFGPPDGGRFVSGSNPGVVYIRLQCNGTPDTNRITVGRKILSLTVVAVLKPTV